MDPTTITKSLAPITTKAESLGKQIGILLGQNWRRQRTGSCMGTAQRSLHHSLSHAKYKEMHVSDGRQHIDSVVLIMVLRSFVRAFGNVAIVSY